MNKQPCQKAYLAGQQDRKSRPLRWGAYKLEERYCELIRAQQTTGDIRGHVCAGGARWVGTACTSEDKHMWLKEVPLWISRMLGEDLLPGLRALSHDGVPSSTIDRLERTIQADVDRLVQRCDFVRLRIARCIEFEYREMRTGGSLVEDLLDEAISLFKRALLLLPSAQSNPPSSTACGAESSTPNTQARPTIRAVSGPLAPMSRSIGSRGPVRIQRRGDPR